MKTGQVLGASDRDAAYPAGKGYTPEEVVATIYSLLGINLDHEYRDHLDRPWKLATSTPIRELLL